jgi:hypothetical protein
MKESKMEPESSGLRKHIIEKILAKQDDLFRWGFDRKQAQERPEYLYYAPNFKSTLWTLILLADLKAPVDLPQVRPALQLITEHFYNPEDGIFGFPAKTRFPIPCLNGNLLYLLHYFEAAQPERLDRTIAFFAAAQRFDDGDFKTPKSYPYLSNIFCYGRHTCYWGVTKLLKGISFIPKIQRTQTAQQLIENCIEFVLQHEVCFSSHHRDELLHRDIGKLTFPNAWRSDFLEILWLLAREEVHDHRMSRALELLGSKRQAGDFWELEKSMNFIVSTGQIGCANPFITERASEVLEVYGG